MDERRKLPPVALLGLANLPFGLLAAIPLITVPQLLAARGVPEPTIAVVTTAALVPSFTAFLVSPILDVKFSRRSYALALALLSAVLTFAALLSLDDLVVLGVLLFAAVFAAQLFNAALVGWIGSLTPQDSDSGFGAWLAVANIGGFGIAAIAAISLLRALPFALGAGLFCAAALLPTAIFAWLPAPGPDRRLAGESFAQFFGDIARLVRQRSVIDALILFVLPAASFALTNQLGGLGGLYGASEKFVAAIAGVGVTIAGVIGSLLVPRLTRWLPPRALYLSIGATGALFTLSLIVLPRTPAMFGVAMIGQNIFQAAAFAVQYAIALRSMGKDNPLAATQFALIIASQSLPITYMQWLDGRAYAAGGFAGSLVVDGGLGLAACAGLALFVRWRSAAAKSYSARNA